MSGRMQENSDIAVRLVPEETRAGGMTTLVLWRAEASIRMERMASALVTASKEVDHFFREVSYCSYPRFDTERDVPDVETNNWRAVCGKTASTVRRDGRRKPSLPLSRSFSQSVLHHAIAGRSRPWEWRTYSAPSLKCGVGPVDRLSFLRGKLISRS